MKRMKPCRVKKWIRHNLYGTGEQCIYRINTGLGNRVSKPETAQINSASDLVSFQTSARYESRKQFLSVAFDRLARGEKAYTVRANNRLAFCGWLLENHDTSFLEEVAYDYVYPEPGAILYDFTSPPDNRGNQHLQQALDRMLFDLSSRQEPPEWVYVSASADDWSSRQTFEKSGFQYYESVVRRTLLFQDSWTVGPRGDHT